MSARRVPLLVMTAVHETIGAFFPKQLATFAAHGFEVHAVSSPGPGLDRLRDSGVVDTHPLTIARKPSLWQDAKSLFALWKLMLQIRPRIVHAHTPKAGLLGMTAALLAGVPIRLYTIHGLPLMTRKGLLRFILTCAERTSCLLASKVFCVSPSLEAVVREMGLCAGGKLTTLGDGSCSGIDLERYNPERYGRAEGRELRDRFGIPHDAVLLTYAGRIARDKGIEVLADAWNELEEEFPNTHLLLCGALDATDPVPEPVLDGLRRHPRVHLLCDWVHDMPPLYAATEIGLLPTYREGLSQVALECAAMKIPLVGTKIPGMVNAVQDGVTGLLVPAGEARPFAVAVRRLLRDPELRRQMGEAGRESVTARFADERVNRMFLMEYRILLGGKTGLAAAQAQPSRGN